MQFQPYFWSSANIKSDKFSWRNKKIIDTISDIWSNDQVPMILFVLRFYGPVNPMGSCRVRSVYLTTPLLGRLSPLNG